MDLDAFKHQLLLRQYPEALHRAVGFLAARAHSIREIERKLEQRRYLPDTIEMVVYWLEKDKLLDDEAFAKTWVQTRSAHQLGKARILQELRLKGVDREIAEAALSEMDGDESEDAATELAGKLLSRYDSDDPMETMRKAVQAMQRRGYPYEDASRALKAALKQKSTEEDEEN